MMERGSSGMINGMEGADENKQLGVLEMAKADSRGACALLLRVLAFIFTLTAAILVGTSKQTKVVPIKIADSLPPLYVPSQAQWHYLSALVYLLAANAIACAYAAVSLILALANKGKRSKYLGLLIFILDAVMGSALFRHRSRHRRGGRRLSWKLSFAMEQGLQCLRQILSPGGRFHWCVTCWITTIPIVGGGSIVEASPKNLIN